MEFKIKTKELYQLFIINRGTVKVILVFVIVNMWVPAETKTVE